jgi:transcriptional regulator with XRE-family HTH domain
MGREIAAKIRNLRTARGWNQTELAERLGVTQASVSRWESGSLPEADKLTHLAELAGESVNSFIGSSSGSAHDVAVLNRFWVRGAVAAGVWTVAYEWPQDDWTQYSGLASVEAPEGKRYGLLVRGDSMNEIYPDGTVLDCLNIDAVKEVRSGQRVIVERRKFDGTVEATVKEYVKAEDGREWLRPRSTNPEFQAIDPANPSEGIEEVVIVAVVIGSYRPE